MIYCFELDGTICTEEENYGRVKPYLDIIQHINNLYNQGHTIKILSARNRGKKNWRKSTKFWLEDWNVKHHELIDEYVGHDVLVSSRAMPVTQLRSQINPSAKPEGKVGFVCSCFDVMHAGHYLMLKDAKDHCDRLVAALQIDPTIDRPEKNKPIQSIEERQISLEACRYVDEIKIYTTEKTLIELLLEIKPDIRILGNDWLGKEYTGKGIAKEEYFHDRSIHSYSTSNLRQKIYEKEKLGHEEKD